MSTDNTLATSLADNLNYRYSGSYPGSNALNTAFLAAVRKGSLADVRDFIADNVSSRMLVMLPLDIPRAVGIACYHASTSANILYYLLTIVEASQAPGNDYETHGRLALLKEWVAQEHKMAAANNIIKQKLNI